MTTPSPSRRKSERIIPTTPVTIRVHDLNVPMLLVDLSLGGFGSYSKRAFKVGETYRFTISLPEHDMSVQLAAEIVHARMVRVEGGVAYVTGWKFLVWADEHDAAIRALIARASLTPGTSRLPPTAPVE